MHPVLLSWVSRNLGMQDSGRILATVVCRGPKAWVLLWKPSVVFSKRQARGLRQRNLFRSSMTQPQHYPVYASCLCCIRRCKFGSDRLPNAFMTQWLVSSNATPHSTSTSVFISASACSLLLVYLTMNVSIYQAASSMSALAKWQETITENLSISKDPRLQSRLCYFQRRGRRQTFSLWPRWSRSISDQWQIHCLRAGLLTNDRA